MLMAALGDIHGNLPALQAVLAEIDRAGIHTLVNTGDMVAGHPWPNEVIDLIRARAIPSVQGELDRMAARFERKQRAWKDRGVAFDLEAVRCAHEAMRSDNLEFLLTLPKQRTLTIEGVTILLCHGSPHGQSDGIAEGDPEMRFRRLREAANADLIVCGHTHRPFVRTVDGVLFVNPGSVGVAPTHLGTACYALIDTEEAPWSARILEASY